MMSAAAVSHSIVGANLAARAAGKQAAAVSAARQVGWLRGMRRITALQQQAHGGGGGRTPALAAGTRDAPRINVRLSLCDHQQLERAAQ